MRHHQTGMSTYTTIIFVLLIGFAAMFAMKVGMPILDNWTVQKILNQVKDEPDVRAWSNEDIRKTISKKFDVNRIEHINVKDDVKITNEGAVRRIKANYDAKVPFFGNIYLLIKFEENVVDVPAH